MYFVKNESLKNILKFNRRKTARTWRAFLTQDQFQIILLLRGFLGKTDIELQKINVAQENLKLTFVLSILSSYSFNI
jgi:hypothetical protein